MYPQPIQQLIRAFMHLPAVGTRTAERYVFHLLYSGKRDVAEIILALKQLMERMKSCEVCWNFTDQSPCVLCKDRNRDTATLCIVARPQEVEILERTGAFHGRYHVLRGLLEADAEEGGIRELKIPELLSRVQNGQIREVILALNPDMNGETTMMLLEKKLHEKFPSLTISRLARGLPMGSDMLYADDITLESALRNRTERR